MYDNRKRGHFYQASANAFGGRIEHPFDELLPVLAPTSLPRVGGYASARHEGFRFKELISVERAYTQVIGSTLSNGDATTVVTSVVEGLNIDNVVFADRIAAQISTTHRPGFFVPAVSFLGTEFRGLRVGSCELNPVLNLGLSPDGGSLREWEDSPLRDEELVARAQQMSAPFEGFVGNLSTEQKKRYAWAEGYADGSANTHEEIANRGNLLCSLVDEFEATPGRSCPGQQLGHAIYLPEFGRIYLAELVVGHGSFDLTMVRFDLGCPVSGAVSVAQGSSAGTPAVGPTGKRGSGGGTNTGP
jgi:hypothetical protein